MEKLGKTQTVVIDGKPIAAKDVVLVERDAATLLGSPQKARPITNRHHKVGRNEPCPCNSGKKFKKCHFLLKQHLVPTRPEKQA